MSRPLTPDALIYDLPQASDPHVAPDGRTIVYVVSTNVRETGKTHSHLWLSDIDGRNARQLTQASAAGGSDDGIHHYSPRWSADGRRLAFVSDRPASGGQPATAPARKAKGSGLFILAMDAPGEAREITRHAHGIGGVAWSPDPSTSSGQAPRIAYTTRYDPDNPDEEEPAADAVPKVRATQRIDYKRDGSGYLGDARSHVFVVDVESGQRRRISTALHEHSRPAWSPDGRWIAAGMDDWATESSPVNLYAVDGDEQRSIDLTVGSFSAWAWSPDGGRILLAGEPRGYTSQPDFYVYTLADGSLRQCTNDLDVLPGREMPVWLDEQRALVHGIRHGASGLYVLDTQTGAIECEQEWTAAHHGLSTDAGRRFVAQGHESFERVGEIAVYDREQRGTQIITDHSGVLLRACQPAGWERLEVQRGGLTIEAWLLKPPGFNPRQRYPLVLDIHGGPQSYFGYEFDNLQQCLATHGFLVAQANPRGSTSYGREFSAQVNSDWGGEDYLDLLAVVDALLERPYVDSARTGILGYSYGGYMTSWIIGQTGRFNACVCGAPVFDLESEYGTGDMDYTGCDWEWGGPPHARREFYAERSPATFAHRATTPTLIIQGEADERCPVGQAEQMFTTLKQAGCVAELARYPGGSHGFPWIGPPAHREDYLARALGWFRRYL